MKKNTKLATPVSSELTLQLKEIRSVMDKIKESGVQKPQSKLMRPEERPRATLTDVVYEVDIAPNP